MGKRIRVIKRFKDLQHNNIIRQVDDVIIEEEERADYIIAKGYAELIEEIKPKVEVETAVKEVKKEKAVKEKAVKPKAKKETKKNAKK